MNYLYFTIVFAFVTLEALACSPSQQQCQHACCPVSKNLTCCPGYMNAGLCAPSGTKCCGAKFCNSSLVCCPNSVNLCYPEGFSCCGSGACLNNQTCCNGNCCNAGQTCCGGECCDNEESYCCGETCCDTEYICCGSECCGGDNFYCCGNQCCEDGAICVNGSMCLDQRSNATLSITYTINASSACNACPSDYCFGGNYCCFQPHPISKCQISNGTYTFIDTASKQYRAVNASITASGSSFLMGGEFGVFFADVLSGYIETKDTNEPFYCMPQNGTLTDMTGYAEGTKNVMTISALSPPAVQFCTAAFYLTVNYVFVN